MVTFKNNNNITRRSNFRRNDRSYKANGDRQKFNASFSNNDNFKRKVPGRNNHNAAKLIEKYNDLAREASSNGDKILSENYLQHADHFTRVLNEKENYKREKLLENSVQSSEVSRDEIQEISNESSKKGILEKPEQTEISKSEKTQVKVS